MESGCGETEWPRRWEVSTAEVKDACFHAPPSLRGALAIAKALRTRHRPALRTAYWLTAASCSVVHHVDHSMLGRLDDCNTLPPNDRPRSTPSFLSVQPSSSSSTSAPIAPMVRPTPPCSPPPPVLPLPSTAPLTASPSWLGRPSRSVRRIPA